MECDSEGYEGVCGCKYIVDGRNIWNRQELEDIGYLYTRIGEK